MSNSQGKVATLITWGGRFCVSSSHYLCNISCRKKSQLYIWMCQSYA